MAMQFLKSTGDSAKRRHFLAGKSRLSGREHKPGRWYITRKRSIIRPQVRMRISNIQMMRRKKRVIKLAQMKRPKRPVTGSEMLWKIPERRSQRKFKPKSILGYHLLLKRLKEKMEKQKRRRRKRKRRHNLRNNPWFQVEVKSVIHLATS